MKFCTCCVTLQCHCLAVVKASLSKEDVSMASPLMTLKTLSGVINISLIKRINHWCAKWSDLNNIHQSSVYHRQDSSNQVPWQGQVRLCSFSLYLSTKTRYLCTHTWCTKGTDNHQLCMPAYTRTQTQYLLWVIADWVNATVNSPVYNVSIQNGGLREEQVLSQSVGRGKRCNSLLLLLDHWESSTSFLHNLSPLRPQRNWGALPFHIYPFLHNPPCGLFPGFPLASLIQKATFLSSPLFNLGKLCNNVFQHLQTSTPWRSPAKLNCPSSL